MRAALVFALLLALAACGAEPYLAVRVEDPGGAAAHAGRLELKNETTGASRSLSLGGRALPASFVFTAPREGTVVFTVMALRDDGEILAGGSGAAFLSRRGGRAVVTLRALCSSAATCDDGDPCNGVEACAGGWCAAGAPPIVNADPCAQVVCDEEGARLVHDDRTDGTACTLTSSAPGVCRAGSCAPPTCADTDTCPRCGNQETEGDEQCDDGNVDPCDGCDACALVEAYSCADASCAPAGCAASLLSYQPSPDPEVEVHLADVNFANGAPRFAVIERSSTGSGTASVRLMRRVDTASELETIFTIGVADRGAPPLDAAFAARGTEARLVAESGDSVASVLETASGFTLRTHGEQIAAGTVALAASSNDYVVLYLGGNTTRPVGRYVRPDGGLAGASFELWDSPAVEIDVDMSPGGISTYAWVAQGTGRVAYTVYDASRARVANVTDLDTASAVTQPRVSAALDGGALALWLAGGVLRSRYIAPPGAIVPHGAVVTLGIATAVDVVRVGRGWAVFFLRDGNLLVRTVGASGTPTGEEVQLPTGAAVGGSTVVGPVVAASNGASLLVGWNYSAGGRVGAILLAEP